MLERKTDIKSRELERGYTVDGGGNMPKGRPDARWWESWLVVL
jgi:hypothetical protein